MQDELEEIAQALESAVASILSFAQKQDFGARFPEVHFSVRYYQPNSGDPSRATGVVEDRTRESFGEFYRRFADQLNRSEPVRLLNGLCNAFVEKHGVDMDKYWKMAYGTEMLSHYFEKVGAFTTDRPTIRSTVREFRTDITAKTEQIELVYYVENLKASKPFSLCEGMISFAPLSSNDLDTYAQERAHWLSARSLIPNLNGWICRASLHGRKKTWEDFNDAEDFINDVLSAFYLVKDGSITLHELAKQVTDTFLNSGRIGGGEPVRSGRGGQVHITKSDIQQLDEVLKRLLRVSKESKLKQLRLPLRRIRSATSRRDLADAFVDTVIALESLLASDTPALEVTHRFRLRGAALLDASFGLPRERMEALRDVYQMRSDIVHGKYKEKNIAPLLERANLILKAVLHWYLKHIDDLKPEEVVSKVDEWMVEGASKTAYPESS